MYQNDPLTIKAKYEVWRRRSGLYIDFETFTHPKELINVHEHNVGTVLRRIDNNLKAYEHITYFGCMLFFSDLTDDQITNGPIAWEDHGGDVNCF